MQPARPGPLACLASLALLLCSGATHAEKSDAGKASYEVHKQTIAERQRALETEFRGKTPSESEQAALSKEIIASLDSLADFWLGSSWGRGMPQSGTPQTGKINCGTFVGTLLRDAGFKVDVRKLQRQPSQAIIKSFVGGKRVRKLVGSSMERFLKAVEEMGPGLFILGMDMHVGILIQTDTELRYLHSSIETGKVVNEAAADAWTIQSSNYRIVGKLLSPKNLRFWLRGKRVEVVGKF
jgi:hypothetical protein